MAVNIKNKKGLEHHRNPSGLHNKVNWLLKQMDWDINNLDKVWDSIVLVDENSWNIAFDLVIYLLKPRHLPFTSFYVYKALKHKWYAELMQKRKSTEK